MAAKVTFDPATRIITVTAAPDGNGRVAIDVQRDLYSAAKLDWRDDAELNKLQFLFRFSFGGQDLGGGVAAGAYYFLDTLSGWRIRPYEASHELVLNGNLYSVDPDTPIFVPPVGAYTVPIRLVTSSLTQQVVSGSGVTEQDKTDIAAEVWDYSQ